MGQLAADIDVPADDVADGRTYAAPPRRGAAGFPTSWCGTGCSSHADAFATVDYDGDWFWIANDDLTTKRVFSFVMLLLSLSESSRPGQPPLIPFPPAECQTKGSITCVR